MMNALKDAVSDSALLVEGDHVLVAVSGGADSMSLLSILASMQNHAGLRVSAAHFDHRLRRDSAADGEVVTAFCRRLGIDCHVGSGDVAGRASLLHESVEEAARDLRYAFLYDTAGRLGATRGETAHTQSDQVETILMRLARGAGVRGVSGIPARRGRIVRPLLTVPGDATTQYCRDNDIPFIVDPTNTDMTIARNKIRHETLPELRRLCHDIDARLLRLGEQASVSLNDTRRRTNPVLERARREADGVWTISCADVATLADDDRAVLFADLVTKRLHSTRELGRVHYDALVAMSRTGAATGKRVSLPGCEVRREHDAMVFTPARPLEASTRSDHGVELTVPGTTNVGGYNVRVEFVAKPAGMQSGFHTTHSRDGKSAGLDSVAVAYFDRTSVGLPLVVRTPCPGDRIRPFGMRRGHKLLSDIFIDNGVPHRRRATTLVVTDSERILWAVGVVTSDAVRVEPECDEIIRVTVTRNRGACSH